MISIIFSLLSGAKKLCKNGKVILPASKTNKGLPLAIKGAYIAGKIKKGEIVL